GGNGQDQPLVAADGNQVPVPFSAGRRLAGRHLSVRRFGRAVVRPRNHLGAPWAPGEGALKVHSHITTTPCLRRHQRRRRPINSSCKGGTARWHLEAGAGAPFRTISRREPSGNRRVL